MSERLYPNHYVNYIDALSSDHSWKLVDASSNGLRSEKIAYYDEQTVALLAGWRDSKQPVEMSVVAVVPNSSVLTMPARVLGYAASALALAQQAQQEWSVNVSSLRVLSPCHVNVYCDGGNIYAKLDNAHKLRDVVEAYKETYYPDLSQVQVTLDVGKTIDDETVAALRPKLEQMRDEQPEVVDDLTQVAVKYARKSISKRAVDASELPLIYLLAHPEAWGYSSDQILYMENGQRRINYMPGSELKYLLYMSRVGNVWNRAADHEVSTMMSRDYLTAPYYKGRDREPNLSDLAISSPGDLRRGYRDGSYNSPEAYRALDQLEQDMAIDPGIMRKILPGS